MLLQAEDRRRWELRDSLNLDALNHWLYFLPWLADRIANARLGAAKDRLSPTAAIWAEHLYENTEASRQRVRRIIQLVAERNAPALNGAIGQYFFVPHVFFPLPGEDLLLEQVYAAKGHAPSFFDSDGTLLENPLPAPPFKAIHPNSPELCPFPAGEAKAVFGVLELAQNGFLQHLGSCGICGQMFLPTRGKQANCSTKCSKLAYSKTPKEKERRRIAARNRYDAAFGTPTRRQNA